MNDASENRLLLPLTVPLSWVYGAAVRVRNRRFDEGAGVDKLPVEVVSVGNLNVGGSGKTPFVALVARVIEALGAPVGILSRGYGRRDRAPFVLVSDGKDVLAGVEESGDEPLELARALPGVAVGVGSDRYETGKRLLDAVGPRVLVLDDGFQHRRLYRNLDLVCFDAGESEANLRLLPAGRLREPLRSLARAHALVWTGCSDELPSDALRSRVMAAGAEALTALHVRTRLVGFSAVTTRGATNSEDEVLPPDAFADVKVGLLAGIARPERLENGASFKVLTRRFEKDHHWWRPDEVRPFVDDARAKGAEAILTTGKDAVKIAPLLASGALRLRLPMYVMRVEAELLDPEPLRSLLATLPGL